MTKRYCSPTSRILYHLVDSRKVWPIEETNEIFTNYDAYLARYVRIESFCFRIRTNLTPLAWTFTNKFVVLLITQYRRAIV